MSWKKDLFCLLELLKKFTVYDCYSISCI
jgi:Asp-tRNA(Asn)/Glu-tRNA(Gln) amidotransferase A subunit family amidase